MAGVLTNVDIAKIQVALSAIGTSLDASPGALQLLISGYALAYGLALVPAGRLGDVRSRKVMFLIGISVFLVASITCALAPNIETLVAFRILQGVAAGIQMPQALGTVQVMFSGRARAHALGTMGTVMTVSAGIAPAIGGLLIGLGGEPDGWRLNFWINVPLGVVGLILAIRTLPATPRRSGRTPRLDAIGLGLLGVATVATMLPFLSLASARSGSYWHWAWLVAAVFAAAGFVLWERRAARLDRDPAVDLALFTLPTFRSGIIVAAAYYAGVPGAILVVMLYVQASLGLGPLFAGLMMIPFSLAAGVTATVGGRLVPRFGGRALTYGLVVTVIGIGVLAATLLVPTEFRAVAMTGSLFVIGAGNGVVLATNQSMLLSRVDPTAGGVAASVSQVSQRIGNSIGITAVTAVYFAGAVVSQVQGVLTAVILVEVLILVGLIASLPTYRATYANEDPAPDAAPPG